jgi:hypothetical protein
MARGGEPTLEAEMERRERRTVGIRPLTLAAALAVVALLVAGCGRSDTDSAGASVTPTGTTA